ncbi:hypothetical protein SRHO_G00323490 [Serrasalmus rhombeus]
MPNLLIPKCQTVSMLKVRQVNWENYAQSGCSTASPDEQHHLGKWGPKCLAQEHNQKYPASPEVTGQAVFTLRPCSRRHTRICISTSVRGGRKHRPRQTESARERRGSTSTRQAANQSRTEERDEGRTEAPRSCDGGQQEADVRRHGDRPQKY